MPAIRAEYMGMALSIDDLDGETHPSSPPSFQKLPQLPLQLPLRRQRPPRVGDGPPPGLGRGAEDVHWNA